MDEDDTIAAVSTAPGEAGIGIVRLSGPRAAAIAERLFESPGGVLLGERPSHTLTYGFIRDPETGHRVDEVLAAVMRAPGTYTREDMAEINCHGGHVPVRRVLELAIKEGARLAGPGEFTRRAFMNGRIDLSQAEAVMDLITAKTGAAERAALRQLQGGLSKKINAIRDGLAHTLAHVEAHIDFPEEEIEPGPLEEIRTGVGDAKDALSELSASYDEGRFLREGLKAVIVGRPNVGKSSILNALLSRDRAIVLETPGTTRDLIEEPLNIKGLPLLVVDTAGIRESHEMAEMEGVRRSLRALDEADLVLAVFDGSAALKEEDHEVLNRIAEKKAVLLLNKSDLGTHGFGDALSAFHTVSVSAKTGQGIQELKEAIFTECVGGAANWDPGEGAVVTNLRHRTALDSAARALGRALGSMDETRPLEITALELREALESVGEIVGDVSTEEILDIIFGEFCIGK